MSPRSAIVLFATSGLVLLTAVAQAQACYAVGTRVGPNLTTYHSNGTLGYRPGFEAGLMGITR